MGWVWLNSEVVSAVDLGFGLEEFEEDVPFLHHLGFGGGGSFPLEPGFDDPVFGDPMGFFGDEEVVGFDFLLVFGAFFVPPRRTGR